MTTQFEYQKNLDTVIDLLVKGAKQRLIAERLKLTERQIRNYVRDAKKVMAEEIKGTTKENLVGQLSLSAKMRMRHLWIMLNQKENDSKDKVAIINSLREEDRDMIKRAQIIGLLPKTEEINVQNNTQINIKISQEEAISKFIEERRQVK